MKSSPHGGKREGAGRPTAGRKAVTLRLAVETLEKLELIAPTRIAQAELIDELVRRSKSLRT